MDESRCHVESLRHLQINRDVSKYWTALGFEILEDDSLAEVSHLLLKTALEGQEGEFVEEVTETKLICWLWGAKRVWLCASEIQPFVDISTPFRHRNIG